MLEKGKYVRIECIKNWGSVGLRWLVAAELEKRCNTEEKCAPHFRGFGGLEALWDKGVRLCVVIIGQKWG